MNTAIWVGDVDGKVLVFDPAIQLPDCPHLFLWNPKTKEMGKYIADLTRKKIRPHQDRNAVEEYISSYQEWHTKFSASWLNEERRYYQDRKNHEDATREERESRERKRKEAARIASLTPQERHKERLDKLGKPYRGVRPANARPLHLRITHCWACNRHLDNSVDIECVACGWILCTCGACGCGYVGLA